MYLSLLLHRAFLTVVFSFSSCSFLFIFGYWLAGKPDDFWYQWFFLSGFHRQRKKTTLENVNFCEIRQIFVVIVCRKKRIWKKSEIGIVFPHAGVKFTLWRRMRVARLYNRWWFAQKTFFRNSDGNTSNLNFNSLLVIASNTYWLNFIFGFYCFTLMCLCVACMSMLYIL